MSKANKGLSIVSEPAGYYDAWSIKEKVISHNEFTYEFPVSSCCTSRRNTNSSIRLYWMVMLYFYSLKALALPLERYIMDVLSVSILAPCNYFL